MNVFEKMEISESISLFESVRALVDSQFTSLSAYFLYKDFLIEFSLNFQKLIIALES